MSVQDPSYVRGRGRGITDRGQPRQKCETLLEKITKSAGGRGMAQVVELLPGKCKAQRGFFLTLTKKEN
jgi:hypothetical protein